MNAQGQVPTAKSRREYNLRLAFQGQRWWSKGIYLIIFEIEHSLAADAKLKEQGVRYTNSRETAKCRNQGFNSIWLHPSGMKGAFIQLSQVLDSHNPWPPAGDTW